MKIDQKSSSDTSKSQPLEKGSEHKPQVVIYDLGAVVSGWENVPRSPKPWVVRDLDDVIPKKVAPAPKDAVA